MSTKRADADQMCEMYYEECMDQLKIDSELQRQIEAEEAKKGGADSDEENRDDDDLSN